MNEITKGAIFFADLEPTIGSEQKGIRPVLVLQNDIGNRHSPTTIVAPITTKKDCKLPTHIRLNHIDDIDSSSVVLLEQIRVIDKIRLKKYINKISFSEMSIIDSAMKVALGLDDLL